MRTRGGRKNNFSSTAESVTPQIPLVVSSYSKSIEKWHCTTCDSSETSGKINLANINFPVDDPSSVDEFICDYNERGKREFVSTGTPGIDIRVKDIESPLPFFKIFLTKKLASARKLWRNRIKENSIETGSTIIAHLLHQSMQHTLVSQEMPPTVRGCLEEELKYPVYTRSTAAWRRSKILEHHQKRCSLWVICIIYKHPSFLFPQKGRISGRAYIRGGL